jgi:hypothetical protein
MNEDKKIILDMLAEGKITSEEADKLLNKLNNCCDHCECGENCNCEKSSKPVKANHKRFLHIKVNEGDNATVNINIPLVLAEVGLKLIPKKQLAILEEKNIDIHAILDMVQNGTDDAIMDVDTINDGKPVSVKIYID